jgi:hypothetical protein
MLLPAPRVESLSHEFPAIPVGRPRNPHGIFMKPSRT